MNVLVTGGAGLIGSNLVAKMLARALAVREFDNVSTGLRHSLAALESDGDANATRMRSG